MQDILKTDILGMIVVGATALLNTGCIPYVIFEIQLNTFTIKRKGNLEKNLYEKPIHLEAIAIAVTLDVSYYMCQLS